MAGNTVGSISAQQASGGGAALQTVRLGVVGLRNIGCNHIRRALELNDPNVRVTAVTDMDAQRVQQAREEFHIESGYTDLQAMLKDSDVDAVVLAVPTHLHVPLSIQAMEAGRHVLVEKPLGASVEAAQQAVAARDRTGRVLAVGMNQRLRPQARAARALIQSGRLGKVRSCRTCWTRPAFNASQATRGQWMFARAGGGGPLLDLGIHKLDLALFLLGFPKPLEVTATFTSTVAQRHARSLGLTSDVEDYGWGCVRLEGHGLLELVSASVDPMTTDEAQWLHIACDNGGVIQQGNSYTAFTYDDAGQRQDIPLAKDDGLSRSSVEHLVRVLQGRETLVPTPEQGLIGLQLLEAMLQSSQQERAIRLD